MSEIALSILQAVRNQNVCPRVIISKICFDFIFGNWESKSLNNIMKFYLKGLIPNKTISFY